METAVSTAARTGKSDRTARAVAETATPTEMRTATVACNRPRLRLNIRRLNTHLRNKPLRRSHRQLLRRHRNPRQLLRT